MKTHFSLKGKPRPDVTDQEKILPETIGDMALSRK